MSRRAEVRLHSRTVGILQEGRDGKVSFRFVDAYRHRVPRPILGQRFEDYDLERVWTPRKHERLPDFFANLVPEGRLRELIEETAAIPGGDDLGLLAFVGEDLPGAVTVLPVGDEFAETSSLPSRPDGSPSDEHLFRFSLAGVQLKFSMLRDEEKLVLPMKGKSGEWIVKLPSPTFPRLPENEYAILRWARATGLEVPECHLHDVSSVEGLPRRFASRGKLLAVRRYDRDGSDRIHQEDWAQVVGFSPALKYEHVSYEAMATLARNVLGDEGVLELVRRLAFVVASGNGDAHLKNWSLLYPDGIRPTWAPTYDQVATVAWPEVSRNLALKLAGVQEFNRIDRRAWERFAERSGVPPEDILATVLEILEKARDVWKEVRVALPAAHRRELQGHWQRVPILAEVGSLA